LPAEVIAEITEQKNQGEHQKCNFNCIHNIIFKSFFTNLTLSRAFRQYISYHPSHIVAPLLYLSHEPLGILA
jgi:hypothetical protein